MRDDKGNKPRSIDAAAWRLKIFFPEEDLLIEDLTPSRCKGYYDALRTRPMPTTRRPLAVDSHRNILAEAKSFLRWCVGKRWIPRNPLDEVTGMGRRRHGKAQLRIDGRRRSSAGWCATWMTRDGLLWIPETQTEAGKRTLPSRSSCSRT